MHISSCLAYTQIVVNVETMEDHFNFKLEDEKTGNSLSLTLSGAQAATLAAGLVDEIDLQISPVILGAGERLFDGFEGRKPALELVRVLEAPGVAHLRYRVVR